VATPKTSIERIQDLNATLEKLSLSDGHYPTDRNRQLKTEQTLRVALKGLSRPEGAATEPEPSNGERAAAAAALASLQKLAKNDHARPLRPLLLSAVEFAKSLAGEATATDAATGEPAKAAGGARTAAPRASGIQAQAQSTRRPVRRGIV
jgi:hypothetical protein